MKITLSLIDYFPDGIFSLMVDKQKLSFLTSDLAKILDDDYLYIYSGDKYVSPNIEKFLSMEGGEDRIINLILNRFYVKWNRLYESYQYDLKIDSNYSKTITIKHDENSERSVTSDNNLKRTGSVTIENENNLSDERSYRGFNSAQNNPVDSNIRNNTNNQTTNYDNVTDSTVYTGKETDDTGYTREVTEEGLNGNITYSELVDEYRKTIDYDFFQKLYDDLDSILVITCF